VAPASLTTILAYHAYTPIYTRTILAFARMGSQLGNFNACALRMDAALSALGAQRLSRVAMGDEDTGSMDTAFKDWSSAKVGSVSSADCCWRVY